MIQKEWPEKEVASTWSQVGDCYEFLGERDMALRAYQQVFNAQREFKGLRTTAHLTYAWIIAVGRVTQLYEDALQVLDEFASPIEFPVDKYKSNAVRAMIAEDRGDTVAARHYAGIALDGLEKKSSGLRYHPSVGLVRDPDALVVRRLRSLAET
jgi:tetratricopeptide (TPR) repeat protein